MRQLGTQCVVVQARICIFSILTVIPVWANDSMNGVTANNVSLWSYGYDGICSLRNIQEKMDKFPEELKDPCKILQALRSKAVMINNAFLAEVEGTKRQGASCKEPKLILTWSPSVCLCSMKSQYSMCGGMHMLAINEACKLSKISELVCETS